MLRGFVVSIVRVRAVRAAFPGALLSLLLAAHPGAAQMGPTVSGALSGSAAGHALDAGPSAPDTHSTAAPTGIWWGIGVGAGALRFTCDLCASDRDRGPSLIAMIGAHASPQLRVALEGGGWTRDDGGVREKLYRAGLTAFFHPNAESGLHVLAGLGWVGYAADDIRYDSGSLNVGVGWDFGLLPEWSVGNALRVEAASFGSFRNDDDRVARDVGLSMLRFEVTLRKR